MLTSKARRNLIMAAFLALALAAIAVPILLFWPSSDNIVIGEESWTMPGGGPAHTAYMPYAPKGSLNEKWNTRLEGKPVGSPVLAGDRAYVCSENGFLYCLELESGRPVWRYDAGAGMNSMPAVFEGGVLLGTLDGRVLEVGSRGELKWEIEVGGSVRSTPIPEDGYVYFGSSDNFVYCVSAEDGSRKWSFDAQSPVEHSLCLYKKQVFGVSFEGDLFALDSATGKLNWTFRSQGVPVVFPAADDDKVFLATEFTIYCSDAQSGKLLWKYLPGPGVISNLAIRGNQVIAVNGLAGGTCNTLALDTRTGDLLWNANSGESPARTGLVATNEDVYLSGPDHLRALTVESGTPAVDHEISGILPETFTITNRHILAGTDSRKVYCFGE
jgi:eukaryotic-like serine/threonine-protein kinase